MFRSLAAVIALTLATAAPGQCDLQWQPGDPVSMPRGNVDATAVWDPDGTGPAASVLVAGGSFWLGAVNTRIATFDGSSWVDIGSPLLQSVTAMAVYNGDLIVASQGKVHRRSGSAWLQIGTYAVSINSATVESMVVFGSDLVIAGRFDTVSGFTANNVARWNGTSWSPLGTGVVGAAYALAVYSHQSQNALYVGGSFTAAGGVPTNNLAIWTGSTWVATAGCNDFVRCLAVRWGTTASTSFLFAGGNFTTIGALPVDKVARYNAAANTWVAMGALAAGASHCQNLLVRGSQISYSVVATQRERAWLWSGSVWNQMGPPLETGPPNTGLARSIDTLTYFGGRYVVGLVDYWGLLGGIWSFDGTNWQSMDGAGIDRPVQAVLPNGNQIVIGGGFRSISGVAMNGVASGSSNNWQPLGGGVTGGAGEVLALARLSNGDLVAGGTFTIATGGVTDYIAQWNGVSWQPIGTGTSGAVRALAVGPGGDLFAGGDFFFAGGSTVRSVARWNGSSWSSLAGGLNGSVQALAVLGNGDLLAGGWFTTASGGITTVNRIARWSGGVWHALGSGVDGAVRAVAEMPNGEIVAGGSFTTAGGVATGQAARWNGSTWLPLPGASGQSLYADVRALVPLPNGDLIVGGDRFQLTSGLADDNLVRVRGGTWELLRLGQAILTTSADVVHAVAVAADGNIVVGGFFHRVANLVSSNVARLTTTCPATALAYGAGCTGTGGQNLLVARTLPWLGSSFRARATGMPPLGLALTVYGFTPTAVPIVSLLPEGGPGCMLLVAPDLLAVALPVAGVVETAVSLGPSPSLVGQSFYHQVAALQLGAAGQVVAITSTNALAMTVGSF